VTAGKMQLSEKKKKIVKFDEGWKRVKDIALDKFLERVEIYDAKELLTRPNPAKEMVDVVDIVFQMCIQREPNNFSERIYNKVATVVTKYFETNFVRALEQKRARTDNEFLEEFAQRWKQAKITAEGINRIFNYLNRYHVPNSDNLLDLLQNCFDIFKTTIYDKFSKNLRECVLKQIEKERNGIQVNRNLLRDNVYIFIGLGQELKTQYQGKEMDIYKEDFERHFINQTKKYYENASDKWLTLKSTPEYLIAVEEIQVKEMNRLATYLNEVTKENLMDSLRTVLLKTPQKQLLLSSSGLKKMLEEGSPASDLERLYALYKNVNDGISQIATMFQEHIVMLGEAHIQNAKSEDEARKKDGGSKKDNLDLIEKIIKLHERFHKHLTRDFCNDSDIGRALRSAFENFINKTNYVVRYLAKYTHSFMLNNGLAEGKSDLEKEEQLQHIKMIYGYIRDKDVFEREYQLYLSHRLLGGTSASDEMEQKMIGLLKKECGYFWAQKLEDMFKDMQTSKELMREFKRINQKDFDFSLDVNICEYGKWPEQVDQKKLSKMRPPADLRKVFDRLKRFYEEKHNGRKFFIRWDKGGGECLVNFNKKNRNEKVLIFKSTYQIMALLCFNEKNRSGKHIFKYKELEEKLCIPTAELKNALTPLIHPKLGVLQKKPSGKKILEAHMFKLNNKFKNPKSRVVIPVFKLQSTKAEPEVPEEVELQRRHQMDAAVVRIMKARRTFKVSELIGEVTQQLNSRFAPDPKTIKRRIEALIAQEYLERDEDDRQSLIYKQ